MFEIKKQKSVESIPIMGKVVDFRVSFGALEAMNVDKIEAKLYGLQLKLNDASKLTEQQLEKVYLDLKNTTVNFFKVRVIKEEDIEYLIGLMKNESGDNDSVLTFEHVTSIVQHLRTVSGEALEDDIKKAENGEQLYGAGV